MSVARGPTWGEQVRVLRKIQGGRCGACGLPGLKLYLDHDHETGATRGLLCAGCNLAEGRGAAVDGLAAYIESPPAVRFGWEHQCKDGTWALDFRRADRRSPREREADLAHAQDVFAAVMGPIVGYPPRPAQAREVGPS